MCAQGALPITSSVLNMTSLTIFYDSAVVTWTVIVDRFFFINTTAVDIIHCRDGIPH